MATYTGADLTNFQNNLNTKINGDASRKYNEGQFHIYNLTDGGGDVKFIDEWRGLDPAVQATYDKVLIHYDNDQASAAARLISHSY